MAVRKINMGDFYNVKCIGKLRDMTISKGIFIRKNRQTIKEEIRQEIAIDSSEGSDL